MICKKNLYNSYFVHTLILLGTCTWNMSLEPFTYLGYADGANHGSRNIASAAWVIFTPDNQVLSLGGSFLGNATNNVAEYSATIELLVKAKTLGIQRITVKLDSKLVVSQLNG